MTIPAATAKQRSDWGDLGPEAKRRRLMEVAAEVFTKRGLDASMPAVAEAAGIGVGSLYRHFDSKDELIAAIVVEQLRAARAQILAGHEGSDAGLAFESTLRRLVEWQAGNDLVQAAFAATSDRPEVQAARGEVNLAWQELLDRARARRSVRPDVTTTDLRLIFAATRAADEVEPGARKRMLELLLDALHGWVPGRPSSGAPPSTPG
jgi:AcrR family transcriptional regulator